MAAGEAEFTRRFLLFLEMVVLLLWSVAMVWFYASGRIDKYLVGVGTFRIQVLVAGLALAVLGWFNWSMRALNAGCGHDHSHDGEGGDDAAGAGGGCGHGHQHEKAADCCGHDHGDFGAKAEACCGHDHHDHGKATAADCCGHDHSHSLSHDHGHHARDGHSQDGAHSHQHSHEGTLSGRAMGLMLLALSVSGAVALTPDDFSDTYKKNMLNAYAAQPAKPQAMPTAMRAKLDAAADAGAGASGGAGGLTLAQIEKVQPRNKDGNFEMDVMQLYYSGSDPEYAKVMKGQNVETIGQIVKDTAAPAPNRWRVFVLQVTCCAADARPYSVPVEFTGPIPPDLQEMGWYKLSGKLDYNAGKEGGTTLLYATGAQPALRPKDQRSLF